MNKSRNSRKAAFILALIMCVSLLFSACEKVPSADDGSGSNSGLSEESQMNARIEIQIEDNNGNNKVQIPKFASDIPSDAIDKLNTDIEPLITVYKDAKDNVLKWPEIFTYTYESDEYLQAVVEYQEMPSLDLDYNVKTFTYDKENDKALQIADALAMVDYTEAKFGSLIDDLYNDSDVGGELKKYEINGFYISESGIVQFFVRLYVDTGMEEYSLMTTVVPKTKKLFTTDENGLYIIE